MSRMRVRACMLPSLLFLLSPFFIFPKYNKIEQPSSHVFQQPGHTSALAFFFFQQPAPLPEVPPSDGCVSAGDPVVRGGTKRGAERRSAAPAARARRRREAPSPGAG